MPRKTNKKMRGTRKVNVIYEPVQRDLADAMDPSKASSRPRVWADMSKAERDAITATYKKRTP
jgi:hypothetical protein